MTYYCRLGPTTTTEPLSSLKPTNGSVIGILLFPDGLVTHAAALEELDYVSCVGPRPVHGVPNLESSKYFLQSADIVGIGVT